MKLDEFFVDTISILGQVVIAHFLGITKMYISYVQIGY